MGNDRIWKAGLVVLVIIVAVGIFYNGKGMQSITGAFVGSLDDDIVARTVGIGTDTPGAELDVNGDIKASGTIIGASDIKSLGDLSVAGDIKSGFGSCVVRKKDLFSTKPVIFTTFGDVKCKTTEIAVGGGGNCNDGTITTSGPYTGDNIVDGKSAVGWSITCGSNGVARLVYAICCPS